MSEGVTERNYRQLNQWGRWDNRICNGSISEEQYESEPCLKLVFGRSYRRVHVRSQADYHGLSDEPYPDKATGNRLLNRSVHTGGDR